MVSAAHTCKLSDQEYVSHIVALSDSVAVALTDGSIKSVSIKDLSQHSAKNVTVKQAPSGLALAGLAALPSTPLTVVSCSADGKLSFQDFRTKPQAAAVYETGLSVTALGVSEFGQIAVGSEAKPDAEIRVYDARQIRATKPLVKYTDSHNDDVTDLQFHPTVKNRLVSGSTDGIVNLFDISIENEDDAVLEAYNHQASIHRTGFFTDSHEAIKRLRLDDKPTQDRLFALSHMETLTVYPIDLAASDESDTGLSGSVDYGDVRELWGCQYVADYQKQHFLVGSNDEQWARLVPIVDGAPQKGLELEGGHGEELVRCFDIWQPGFSCFTGGEDGAVKVWDLAQEFEGAAQLISSLAQADSEKPASGKAHKKHLKRPDPLDGRPQRKR